MKKNTHIWLFSSDNRSNYGVKFLTTRFTEVLESDPFLKNFSCFVIGVISFHCLTSSDINSYRQVVF